MGLRPLDLAAWIELDEAHGRELALKRRILAQHRDQVLRVQPAAAEAVFELHAVLGEHLCRTFPAVFAAAASGLSLRATGETFAPPATAEEAFIQMAAWVQEDLCLMSPQPPVRLEAGCVCFPSRWSLADKMGLDSDGIHGPVPRFAGALAASTTAYLEKVQLHKPVWRLNWTIHDSDQLFAPVAVHRALGLTARDVLDRTFLRVERQTLRRLPRTGYVVFTIRTYVTSMAAVAADPGRRCLVHEVIETLPDDLAAYKGLAAFRPALLEALGASPG
jgi:hypothetical protein